MYHVDRLAENEENTVQCHFQLDLHQEDEDLLDINVDARGLSWVRVLPPLLL